MRFLVVAAALVSLASAISFPAPSPTLTQDSDVPEQSSLLSQTTPAPRLKHRQWALSRRQESIGSYEIQAIDQQDPAACGYYNGQYTDGSMACWTSSTCVLHQRDINYPAMVGCSSGTDVFFESTCVDASQASATPSLTETTKAFTLYCTDSDIPKCGTYIYSDIDVTDFVCDESTGIYELWTTGLSYYDTGTTVDRYDAFLTQVDDSLLRSFEASFATATPSPNSTVDSGPGESSSSSSSSSKSNTGAIAGGVVGGVAGVAAIAAALFFLRRKRKGTTESDSTAGITDHGGDYKAVPEPAQSVEIQPTAAEMESGDPAHALAEVPGSSGAYEMDSRPTGQTGKTGETGETGVQGKQFIAELPADSHHAKS
ncbi:hypothetical protein BJX99DRAFT_258178 [Aspergillus californicus]